MGFHPEVIQSRVSKALSASDPGQILGDRQIPALYNTFVPRSNHLEDI